ncbi:MAG: hypothetical protein GEU98_25960 [Pseudonocardiaceae bacterium]|nr:hypothetical protein [Pseudonocardiaceae bacterium]
MIERDRELRVAVDELDCTVTMTCQRCGAGGSAITSRLVAACRASLLAARCRPHSAAPECCSAGNGQRSRSAPLCESAVPIDERPPLGLPPPY